MQVCEGSGGSGGNGEAFAKDMGKSLGQPYRHFLGSTSEREKGPVILGFCDTDIPLTSAGFDGQKQFSAYITPVNSEQTGYITAPIAPNKNGKYVKGENAKELSELVPWTPSPPSDNASSADESCGKSLDASKLKLHEMMCYPYGIRVGKPKEKGERAEHLGFLVSNGKSLRFTLWADSARGGKSKGRELVCDYPGDFIPAFTPLRVQLIIKVCFGVCIYCVRFCTGLLMVLYDETEVMCCRDTTLQQRARRQRLATTHVMPSQLRLLTTQRAP